MKIWSYWNLLQINGKLSYYHMFIYTLVFKPKNKLMQTLRGRTRRSENVYDITLLHYAQIFQSLLAQSIPVSTTFYAPKPHGEQNSIQRSSHSFHTSSFIHQCFFITGVFTGSFSTPVNTPNGWCRTKYRTTNLVVLSMWHQDNQQHNRPCFPYT